MGAIFRHERWRPPSWRTIGTRLRPIAGRSCEYAAAIGTCTAVNNSDAATQLAYLVVAHDGACWAAPMIDGWFAVLKKGSPRSLGKNQPEGSPKGKERFLRLIDTPFPRPSKVEYPMRREQGSAGETLRRKQ